MSELTNSDIDALLEGYRADYQPDVAAGLRRLQARTGGRSGRSRVSGLGPRAPKRSNRRRWLAAAAAVLLLIGSLTLFLNNSTKTLTNFADAPQKFHLPDGTFALLQAGSSLTYNPDEYNADKREVELTGQAYLDVVHNPAKPFYLYGPRGNLRVTGTSFNVRSDPGEFEVEVSEGSVMLFREDGEWPVGRNNCGLIDGPGPAQVMDAPNLNRHAWRTGEFRFENLPLDEALKCIKNALRVDVEVEGKACAYPVSGNFTGEAQDVLSAIAKLDGGSCSAKSGTTNAYVLSGICGN